MRLKSIFNLMLISVILWSCANDKKADTEVTIVETEAVALTIMLNNLLI